MPHPFTVRAVLFDWDGTLLDSYSADTAAYFEMFHALGIDWGLDDLARHYSPDWHRVYRAAGLPHKRWEEADRRWRQSYLRHRPRLLPGAREVLRKLNRKFTLGLVTSGDRWRVVPQLRRLGLARFFAASVCGGDAALRKPHPAPLVLALQRLRLKPQDCVYVGDAPEDIEMARRAGLRAIAVVSAFSSRRRLLAEHPAAMLRSIRELPRLLAGTPPAATNRD